MSQRNYPDQSWGDKNVMHLRPIILSLVYRPISIYDRLASHELRSTVRRPANDLIAVAGDLVIAHRPASDYILVVSLHDR